MQFSRSHSLLRQLDARRVFALHFLHDGLPADHTVAHLIVGERRLPVDLTALVDLRRGTVAEAGIIGACQIAVEFHGVLPAITSAIATVRRAISACMISTMRPSTVMTPLPLCSGRSKAAMILRAHATSASGG